MPRLSIVVSIDGLQPEHDARRTPATYDRILKHIAGHSITVHCTVTRQQVNRAGLPRGVPAVLVGATGGRKIWMSLYTPQIGESLRGAAAARRSRARRGRPAGAAAALSEARRCRRGCIDVYADPPPSPDECVFARTTMTISADLTTRITPCQFGGTPDCTNCGCIASAGLAAVARHQLSGFIPIGIDLQRLAEESASACGGCVRPRRAA